MEKEKKEETKTEKKYSKCKLLKFVSAKTISVLALIVILLLAGVWGGEVFFQKKNQANMARVKGSLQKFISENMIEPGTDFSIKEISEERGLYKLKLSINSKEYISYATKDGTMLFQSGIDLAEKANAVDSNSKDQSAQKKDIPKNDKPEVELFVMSYCPFGTQIEKGILPALDVLGSKVDFSLKFVDYAMHDEKEIDENLREYCIQKTEPAKLKGYLSCFLKDSSKSNECLASQQISKSKLDSCVASTDAQFEIKKKFKDKGSWKSQFPPFDVNKDDNDKYGVQGSPTLVINGVQSDSSKRDPAGMLKTICAAFNNQPDECKKELSSQTPSSGFGEGTNQNATPGGGCGE